MKKIIGIISIFVVLGVVISVGYYGYGKYKETLDYKGKVAKGIEITMKNKMLRAQAGKEELYLETFNKGDYTLKKPYIVQNPYDIAPLTALVMFNTEQPTKVSITIKGRTEQTDITHQFEEFEKVHSIPVLGLLSDTNNEMVITATTKDGAETSSTIHIQTEALPSYIGKVDIKTLNKKTVDIGEGELTFVVPSTKYPFAFDESGDIRWYSSKYNSHIFKELKNGHILFLTKESIRSRTYSVLVEMDYMGKLYHVYDFNKANAAKEGTSKENETKESSMVHHDAIELPNGNLLLTVNDDSQYVEDTMIEVNRETGDIEKVIDLKEILPLSFYENYRNNKRSDGKADWFHQNSVVYDESDDSIVISGRNQDTVMKLDYKTNKIKWILAADENWPADYQKYVLKEIGDVKFNAGQHTATIIPDQDNNADTIDILLYDNNVVVNRGDKALSKKYSRAAQYRINEKDKTVEEVWSFGEQFGEAYFTNIVGSTRWLEDSSHRLINFGFLDGDTRSSIFEVSETGDVAMEANITGFPKGARAYRAERLDLYNKNWEYSLNKNGFFIKAYKKILE
ncbi:aryl-sulfate sulfotransferase [Viridibacillus sp. FSL E2-0187]|uniref:aryl-sulfate sulfotransferase n=1 Tax=Viridibacillus sp. FSL E2-0187 TaxID=2921362 RepID=UPI0030FBD7CD